jgi:hypothetical protein
MSQNLGRVRTEADCLKDDANDPLLALLDDENVSAAEIFETFGIDPVPATSSRG